MIDSWLTDDDDDDDDNNDDDDDGRGNPNNKVSNLELWTLDLWLTGLGLGLWQ